MKQAFLYSIILCGIAYALGFCHGLQKRQTHHFVAEPNGLLRKVTEDEFWNGLE